jgi:hypothetical protein
MSHWKLSRTVHLSPVRTASSTLKMLLPGIHGFAIQEAQFSVGSPSHGSGMRSLVSMQISLTAFTGATGPSCRPAICLVESDFPKNGVSCFCPAPDHPADGEVTDNPTSQEVVSLLITALQTNSS